MWFCAYRICERKAELAHKSSLVAAWLSTSRNASANDVCLVLEAGYLFTNSKFPEMIEVDSLEKWRPNFSLSIINSAVFVKQKKIGLLKLLWNVVFLLVTI